MKKYVIISRDTFNKYVKYKAEFPYSLSCHLPERFIDKKHRENLTHILPRR